MIHFDPSEFDCRCCSLNNMQTEVYDKIDHVRSLYGHPLHINSGTRCPKHNKEVGGKNHSFHLLGKAVDVSLLNIPISLKQDFIELVKSQFNGIGIAKTFIHMDIRQKPTQWTY